MLIVDDIPLVVSCNTRDSGDGEEIALVVLYTQDDTNSVVRVVTLYLVHAIWP